MLASTQIRDKSKACLTRALLWFIGIPYKITPVMIRFVMKVCYDASITLVLVQSLKIPFLNWGH